MDLLSWDMELRPQASRMRANNRGAELALSGCREHAFTGITATATATAVGPMMRRRMHLSCLNGTAGSTMLRFMHEQYQTDQRLGTSKL